MNIIPKPKHLTFRKEQLNHEQHFQIDILKNQDKIQKALKKLKQDLNYVDFSNVGPKIVFIETSNFNEQQYEIDINQLEIRIKYKSEIGCYYAVLTLIQIFNQSLIDKLDCLIIKDEPDFKDRGLMLDISRNRVYKVETIYKIIDLMSNLKMNQLQLNVEGNSYYYPSKDKYYRHEDDMLTTEDIRKIDAYAEEKYINFIPNQNSFGHMSFWLNQQEFNHLAESPEGFTYRWMVNSPSSTINPNLDESAEFVKKLFDEFLVGFSSKTVNIGADEPFELGLGASKKIVEKEGRAVVYAKFINKIYKHLKEQDYKIMMWGDVIKNHQEVLEMLPNDIIALEWGYDEHSFNDEDLEKYTKKGFQFYVCPGTSMWNSIVGIHGNMLSNIKRAAKLGKKHQALGLLNTDWGDGGSWQQLSLSYIPYAIGAAYAWNAEEEQDENVYRYLDKYVYKANDKSLANFFLSLGNAYRIEKSKPDNATQLFKLLYIQQTDHINFGQNLSEPLFIIKDERLLSYEEYDAYETFFNDKLSEYSQIEYYDEDIEIMNHEVMFSLKMLLVASQLGKFKTKLYGHDINRFKKMLNLLKEAMEHYEISWKHRNKESDYKLSTLRMKDLKAKLEAIIVNH